PSQTNFLQRSCTRLTTSARCCAISRNSRFMKSSRLAPFVWLAFGILAFAQNPAPPTPPVDPPKTITKEQTIYVPFDKLEQVFENQERGVFLPYREFLEMWNKLNLPEKLKAKEPPIEGVLAGANYAGKVTGDVAEIKAKLSFE